MPKRKNLLFLCSIAILTSCETQTDAKKPYFDIDSLVNAQVKNLVASHARIVKTASLNEVKAKSEFATDSIGWATELDIFRQLDIINKPTNKDSYLVADGEKDFSSNLIVRSYKAKRDLPVQLLKLYYYKDLQNLKKVEAVFGEKNSLYITERSLTMNFDDVGGENRLTYYSINGIQKMVLGDTVRFTIQCNVIF